MTFWSPLLLFERYIFSGTLNSLRLRALVLRIMFLSDNAASLPTNGTENFGTGVR
jgi:hypothetical protein